MTRASTRRRRHSPAVYRRRRLLVLLLAVLVAAGITWLLIAQPWRGWALPFDFGSSQTDAASPSPSRTPTPTSSSTSTATPTPSKTPKATPTPDATGTAKPCLASDILVEAVTDADAYQPGQNPKLSIKLTNTSDVACTLNVGTTTQVFTVSSGSDVWWRSTDCQTEPSDMVVTLAAGQTVKSATPLEWDRTRSSVSTCDTGGRAAAPGGGASYHVTVEIGGIPSTDSKQILLY